MLGLGSLTSQKFGHVVMLVRVGVVMHVTGERSGLRHYGSGLLISRGCHAGVEHCYRRTR